MWIRKLAIFGSALLFATGASAQHAASKQWNNLLDRGRVDEARSLCTEWTSSPSSAQRAEGYKCLANVALCGKELVSLEGNEAGGGSIRGGYQPEALDEAIKYLQEGLKAAPQDLSIHRGRLHLLQVGLRFDDMAAALDESCQIYRGKEGADAWIAYTSELFEDGHYTASLVLLKVLLKYFPNSHDVIGNLGAVYMTLKQDEDALPYLKKAVELAPMDAIDTWNMGRIYDFTGKVQDADTWYQKAFRLKWDDPGNLKNSRCLYGSFVEQKLNDRKRACTLQRADCPKEKQTACSGTK